MSLKDIFCLLGILCFVVSVEADWENLYDDSSVAEIEITVDPVFLQWIYLNPESDSLHPATVHFRNVFYDEIIDSVGFGLRGNTSRQAQKKSFKLSFNTFVPGRQFHGVDKINLNGEHNDPSIIRSKLCWDIFRKTGLHAPRAAHAVVYINGEYYGLYISVEHIDDEFLQHHFSDASGNLWKCLYPADLAYRGPSPEDYQPWIDETRPYELKTNTEQYDFSQLARFISIVNNTPEVLFPDSLESIFHIADFLKYIAVNVLVGSWDDYWFLMNNYYLYFEPSSGKFHWIPYDYDNTFGVDWFDVDWAQVNPYVFSTIEETQGQGTGYRPLIQRMLEIPEYRNLYSHFLQVISERIYHLDLWENRIDSLESMIEPFVSADSFRTLDYGFTMNDFHDSYLAQHYSNQHVKRGIKEFVNLRNSTLSQQLTWVASKPIVYEAEHFPAQPASQDSILISASVFSAVGLQSVYVLRFPQDLSGIDEIPMTFTPDTNSLRIEDRDRWMAVLSPLDGDSIVRYQIRARDINGQQSVFPRTGPVIVRNIESFHGSLFINEIMAINDSVIQDNYGEYDDWIEIYNVSDSSVELTNMYLTDDFGNLTKWRFSEQNVSIPAGSFLLVWCDKDADQTGLHADFKLDGDGEFIALVDTDGISIIDSVSFGPQSADISYCRYPDGGENWFFSTSPTPLSPNAVTSATPEITIPGEIYLSDNFPNPFNSFTKFHVCLPFPTNVTVSVFDLSGRRVAVLTKDTYPAGEHRFEWDGRSGTQKELTSGVYFLVLETPEKRISRKIILLK